MELPHQTLENVRFLRKQSHGTIGRLTERTNQMEYVLLVWILIYSEGSRMFWGYKSFYIADKHL